MVSTSKQSCLESNAYIVDEVVEDAVDKSGLVVTRTNAVTAGNVTLVDTDKEPPVGVVVRNSYNPVFGEGSATQFLTGQRLPIQKNGRCLAVLASDNAEINIGDDLMAVVDGAGKEGVIDKLTVRTDSAANLYADLQARIGFAREYAAALAGATYGTKIEIEVKVQNA